jgi:hypothetical protein
MTDNSIDINRVNELDPQIIFDELQNVFEELYHDFKKMHKKLMLLQNKLDTILNILIYYKKKMIPY